MGNSTFPTVGDITGLLTPNFLEISKGFGRLFYIVSPSETTFESMAEVPNFIVQAYPYFISTIIIEILVLFVVVANELKKRRKEASEAQNSNTIAPTVIKGNRIWRAFRLNDMIGSISAGMNQQMARIFVAALDVAPYVYIWEHYRVVTPDVHNMWVWIAAFLGIDLCYYWLHRCVHEINILWAGHVVHHSSEEYNQSTALRQSIIQDYTGWVFYLPLAFILPPPVYAVHKQFNVLYQYWVHTEIVGKLGILEWVINTPSHHRVHHGRNPYCIDKNYAGTLIIWDRLFCTFTAERDEEPVLYGLTHNVRTFNPIKIQTHHLVHVLKTAWNTTGIVNKIWVFLKGPGWTPTKPQYRLGDPADIPRVPNVLEAQKKLIKERKSTRDIATSVSQLIDVYDPKLGRLTNTYIFIQFLVMLVAQNVLMTQIENPAFPKWLPPVVAGYVLLALTTIGNMLDAGESQPDCIGVARVRKIQSASFYEAVRLLIGLFLARSTVSTVLGVESELGLQVLKIVYGFVVASLCWVVLIYHSETTYALKKLKLKTK
eukprot:Colp12_sorted_trinity150504_noHs@24881